MLKLLSKSGYFFQLLVFLAVATALWMPSFLEPSAPVLSKADGYLYTLLVQGMAHSSSLPVILGFVFTLLFSFLLTSLFSEMDLYPRNNLLISILTVTLLSCNNSLATLNSLYCALIPLLFAIYGMMRLYGREEAYGSVFSISFSIALASLFLYPLIYLLAFVWMGFLTYRILTWREWVISVIGATTPYIYLVSILFLTSTPIESAIWLKAVFDVSGFSIHLTLSDQICLALSAITGLFCFFSVFGTLNEKLIMVRRRIWIVIDFLLLSLICIGLSQPAAGSSYLLLVIPFCFFTAHAISASKNRFSIPDILTSMLMVLVFLTRFVF